MTAQIEEIRNSPELTSSQKRSEIERVIEAFKRGSQYPGSLEDKAIETLIEYASPEADEDTRILQRNAVKWIFETDDKKSEQHMGAIQAQIEKMFSNDRK